MDIIAELRAAQDRLKENWASIPNLPYEPKFEGTFDDLECLDYLQYEGIAYVGGEDEVDIVGMYWGQVFANVTGCSWRFDAEMGLPFLEAEAVSDFRLYPTVRIHEALSASVPQFGKLCWAMCAALVEYSQKCYWDVGEEAESRIAKILREDDEYVPSVRATIREMTKRG